MSKYLALSLMIVCFILGIGFGYGFGPSYRAMSDNSEKMGLGNADRFVDQRYIDEMIKHHMVAMKLAEQAKDKSARQEIKDLSSEILQNEPKLIEELYGWKKAWYNNEIKVDPIFVPNLGEADSKFDLRFLNALISHHKSGIEMTKEIRAKSSRTEILNNADSVENFLEETLITFEQWRKDWYQI